MLPYVPAETLRRNPNFQALYTDLLKNKLHVDGSSREYVLQDRSLDQEVDNLRVRSAKDDIIREQLSNLSSRDQIVPDEMQETINLVAVSLKQDDYMISSTIEQFHIEDRQAFVDSIDLFSRQLSKGVTDDAAQLKDLALVDVENNQLGVSTSLTQLTSQLSINIDNKSLELSKTRSSIISTLDELMKTYNDCIEQCIKILEQAKLGVVSRATKAQARHLALVAEGFEGKLRIMHFDVLDQLYDPETLTAIEKYKAHLKNVRIKLLQRQKIAQDELDNYASSGQHMKSMVGEYGRILRDIEAMNKDLKKLGVSV